MIQIGIILTYCTAVYIGGCVYEYDNGTAQCYEKCGKREREREKNEKKEQVKVVTHFTRSGSLEVSIRRTTISGRHI